MTVRQPGSVAPTNNQGKGIMSSPNSKKRKARAAIAVAVAAAAGATGVGPQYGLGATDASAATDAKAGTVIRVEAGTYYPSATLKSQNSGATNARITLEPYGNGVRHHRRLEPPRRARRDLRLRDLSVDGGSGDKHPTGSTAIGATMTYLS
jgi:hypothetical protein